MDLKIDGATPEIIRQALAQTHAGRDYIIDNVILEGDCPAASRGVPLRAQDDHHEDRPGQDPGGHRQGGATIQKIVADTGAKIDIDDDGTIHIAAVNGEQAEAAHAAISAIVFEPEVGEIYTGKVTGIKEFGCFVSMHPAKEGMVHISKIANRRLGAWRMPALRSGRPSASSTWGWTRRVAWTSPSRTHSKERISSPGIPVCGLPGETKNKQEVPVMAANRDSYDRRNARGDYPSDGAGSYARRSGGLSQKEKGKIVNVGAWGLLALILLLGVIRLSACWCIIARASIHRVPAARWLRTRSRSAICP